MEELKKNKKIIIYLVVGLLILALTYTLLFTSYPKDLYRSLKKQFAAEKAITQKDLDSIQNLRDLDLNRYLKKLDSISENHEAQLSIINDMLDDEIQKNIKYEKELTDYRNSDFNKRFGIFSGIYDFNPKN